MKRLLGLVLCVLMLSLAVVTNAELDNDQMFSYILDEFTAIAQIPRGSGNTDAISDYLKAWGEEHGFATMQDEVGNIRWDVPATPGYENAPLTVL